MGADMGLDANFGWNAVLNKRTDGTDGWVYGATQYVDSNTIVCPVWDDFHPDANWLGDVPVTSTADLSPPPLIRMYNYASSYSTGFPLLQGYPNNLERAAI